MAVGYRMADARVGVSEGVVEDLAALSGLTKKRFSVIHNPVPPRTIPARHVLAQSERLWNGAPGARLLAVGRLKKQKNHALLLCAFARLGWPDARLMLVGDGELEGELRCLADALGIADQVIFAGFQPDPTSFYRTADLFVLTSDHEGFGNVIVEAMACGTPVISTDCPSGPAEILAGGKFGTLVPVGDEVALAHAIKDALLQPRNRKRLQARARDFAPERAAQAYLRLLTG